MAVRSRSDHDRLKRRPIAWRVSRVVGNSSRAGSVQQPINAGDDQEQPDPSRAAS